MRKDNQLRIIILLCLAASRLDCLLALASPPGQSSISPISNQSQAKNSGKTTDFLIEKGKRVSPARRLNLVKLYMESGQYAEAIKILDVLIKNGRTKREKSSSGNLFALRSYCLMMTNRLKEGIKDADKALERDPNNVWVLKNRSIANSKLGLTDSARADLTRVQQIQKDPKYRRMLDISDHVKYAIEARQKEQPDLTIAHSRYLLKVMPASAVSHFLAGDGYFEMGKFDLAIEEFSKVISVEPGHAYALNYRGAAYAKLGQNKSAIADYSRVIALRKKASGRQLDAGITRTFGRFLAPSLSELYVIRAELRLKERDFEQALADLDQAINLNPRDDQARFARITALRQMHEKEKALSELDALLKLNPQDEKALLSKSEVLMEVGRFKEALQSVNQAIMLDNEDWRSYEIKVKCHQQLGNASLAAESMRRMEQLKKNSR